MRSVYLASSAFISGMTCLLLATLSQAASLRLQLESPREYQVFQRQTAASGLVKIAGTAAGTVRYRIAGEWASLPVNPQTRRFDAVVTVPAGGWYRLEVESGSEKTSIPHFGVGEVFVVAGQSNAGNYGSEKLQTQSRRVSSFDGTRWQIADDPQAGAGGKGGSFMPAFGDAVVQKLDVPVALIPVAAGGTSVREWLPVGIRFKQQTTTGGGVRKVGDNFESTGALFARLTERLKAMGTGGIRAVLWHQGESDAGQARSGYPADRQISGPQYTQFMEVLIRRSREAAGWPVPWFTAITTYHSEQDASDEEFRQAMKKVWSLGLAQAGPDTDTLRADLRAGVHFNGKGLKQHGELWADKVLLWLEKELAPPGR